MFNWLVAVFSQMFCGVAVKLVITGFGFTLNTVVAVVEQIPRVAVKVYVPDAAMVGDGMFGFCSVLAKVFGPAHAYVSAMSVVPVKFTASPSHTGPLLLADAVGVGVTTVDTSLVVDTEDVCVQITLAWK